MNELAIVSTDHCPFCMKEQKELGLGDFSKIPNGIGGVEHRLELLYQGVVNGEITLERWVETCCTTPARMFGMYPTKGIIAPGADADVLVWDPNGHTSIGFGKKHHMNMDHSAWEGFEVDGKVDTVLSRGTVVVENDTFTGRPGHGRYHQARPLAISLMTASLAPKTPLVRRVSLRLAPPGLRPNARPDHPRSLRMGAEAVTVPISTAEDP